MLEYHRIYERWGLNTNKRFRRRNNEDDALYDGTYGSKEIMKLLVVKLKQDGYKLGVYREGNKDTYLQSRVSSLNYFKPFYLWMCPVTP